MAHEQTDSDDRRSICPGCGQSFTCGAVNGDARCWCMEQPSGVFEPSAGASCYCPACLNARINQCACRAT
ncbi:MAG: cysteine-rich CWC family protein [Betaproteobacteria bacterium]|nr:cysteine-rich CWC family protein [Betaproteobacteria bacterium]